MSFRIFLLGGADLMVARRIRDGRWGCLVFGSLHLNYDRLFFRQERLGVDRRRGLASYWIHLDFRRVGFRADQFEKSLPNISRAIGDGEYLFWFPERHRDGSLIFQFL